MAVRPENADKRGDSPKRRHGVGVAFTAGALSASCSTLMFQPFDLVKTRMQASYMVTASVRTPVYLATASNIGNAGMLSTFFAVVRGENFAALWKGTLPSMQRCVPSIGVYFATIHFLKTSLGKTDRTIGPVQALAIGASARAFAACSFLPFTVVKTRFESGHYNYRSVFNALVSIWKTEGSKGLFSGLWATLARDVPFSALYLLFYTQSKQFVMKALKEDHLPSQYYLPCGILAGVMSTLITQPADVIKTRMQIQPQVYPTLPITIASVVRDRGLGGLFIGTLPRTTRRTLMAAFTWAFYEQIVEFIQRGLNGRQL